MSDKDKINYLREQIAKTVIKRDALKLAIETGKKPISPGFRELHTIDSHLSDLDTQFKQLWDKENSR